MDRIDRATLQALEIAKSYRRGDGQRWRIPTKDEIRGLRSQLGLTQREFAFRYGFDLDSLKSWEIGRRTPDNSHSLLLRLIEKSPETIAELVQQVSIEQELIEDKPTKLDNEIHDCVV